MNTINNNNNEKNSLSSNENILNDNKKLELPKISQEYIPSQRSPDLLNKINDNKNLKLKPKKSKLFIISSEDEKGKNNILTLNNKMNDENQIIKQLLNDKITINIKNNSKDNKNKLFQRNLILRKYMNEAVLYRKSIFQRKKKIHVGKIFKISSSYDKNNNIDDLNKNLKTIDTSINSRISGVTKKLKRFKTLDKNIEINNYKSIDYLKPNLRKINCNLKFNFNQNQSKIDEINEILSNLQEETKATFDGFRNDAYRIIDRAYHKRESL